MTKRTKITLAIFAIALMGVAVAIYLITSKDSGKIDEKTKSNVEGQLDRENQDRNNTQNEQPATSDQQAKKSVNPLISRWGKQDNTVEAAGFIQGIYEEGGTCTFVFTYSSARVTRTSTSFKDATTTTCPPVQIPVSEFNHQGQWKVQLEYNSPTATGLSPEQNLTI